jgi:hypothetical protein
LHFAIPVSVIRSNVEQPSAPFLVISSLARILCINQDMQWGIQEVTIAFWQLRIYPSIVSPDDTDRSTASASPGRAMGINMSLIPIRILSSRNSAVRFPVLGAMIVLRLSNAISNCGKVCHSLEDRYPPVATSVCNSSVRWSVTLSLGLMLRANLHSILASTQCPSEAAQCARLAATARGTSTYHFSGAKVIALIARFTSTN